MALSLAALVLALALPLASCQLDFEEIPASPTVEFVLRTTTKAFINGMPYPIKYFPLLESGKTYPGVNGMPWAVGTVLDRNGVVITAAEHPLADPAAARDFDKTSIFEKFGRIWMITQNEDSFGNYFLMRLSQSPFDGTLSIVWGKSINTGPIYGSVRPCSGSITPWYTHLAGEETVIEAKNWPPASVVTQYVAQAVLNRVANWTQVNPYWHGWFVEIAVMNKMGDHSIKKRYAMGRANWETGVALGDGRSFLCDDDTGNGGIITLFVADKHGDLSCGKIFASKPIQLNPADGGSFKIEWVPLNNRVSVCESDVFNAIKGPTYGDSLVKFADLFEIATPVFLPSGLPNMTAMPAGFREVRSIGTRYEWLMLKPGMQGLASVMETARMASYMGASTEWTKAEGASYDKVRKEVYFALSSIRRTMLDNVYPVAATGEFGGINAIRLPQNEPGAVYRMQIGPVWGVSTTAPLNARAVLNSWGGYTASAANFSVPAGSIASPDNVSIMSRYRTLLIGEDCDIQHPNNFMWAYNVDTGSLKRLMSVPYDAEVTSSYYYRNIGRFSYMTATVQHPRVEDMPATMGYWVLPRERE